ncbi:MAG: hypothetical protein JXB49_07910 [Bacteroidales bacterium]|nr:hypothetical protein [Bacteroidales bacterium]
MKKKTKMFVVILITILFSFNVLMTYLDATFGIFNYINFNRYYVYSGGSKSVNDVWIQPLLSGEERFLSFFPLFGYHYIGHPYLIGLRAIDKENKQNCIKMEIYEITIKKGNRSFEILTAPVFVNFNRDLDGLVNSSATWIAPAGEWSVNDKQETVVFEAKYKIYTNTGVIENRIEVTFKHEHDARIIPFYKMWE